MCITAAAYIYDQLLLVVEDTFISERQSKDRGFYQQVILLNVLHQSDKSVTNYWCDLPQVIKSCSPGLHGHTSTASTNNPMKG